MPPNKKQKVSKTDQLQGEEAKSLIQIYLETQYRPYSVSDIVLNLHDKVSKPVAMNLLQELVEAKRVIGKAYGKAVYYIPAQRETKEEKISTTAKDLEDIKNECEELESKAKAKSQELQRILAEPTDEQLKKDQQSLISTVKDLEDQIEMKAAECKNFSLDSDELQLLDRRLARLDKVYKERRRNFNDFKDLLKENMSSYRTLFTKLGIEEVED